MKLYCLSGLGVDHRAFSNIAIENVELVHIPWIEPKANDTLRSYAARLFDTADMPNEYSLMGVSFGGMIAQEFAKIRKPKHLFLISTIRTNNELSNWFRIGGMLRLHFLIPTRLLQKPNGLVFKFFGVSAENDKNILREILNDTDPHFFKWAIRAILNWKLKDRIDGIRIHGTKDVVLPMHNPDFKIDNSGHFMILTEGDRVSKIIHQSLNRFEK